jgi:hypothetical protein
MVSYIARKYFAPSPDAEILGQMLSGFVHNLCSEAITPILQKHGIYNFDPDQWYPMQTILDIERDINRSIPHTPENAAAVGLKAAEIMPFPGGIRTVPGALSMINRLMNRLVRNVPDDFGVTLELVTGKHVRMFCNLPFADEENYDFVWGVVNRFKPAEDVLALRTIENPYPAIYPGTCFDIQWGATFDEIT